MRLSAETLDLHISPNPASEMVNVATSLTDTYYGLEVYNMLGQKVYRQEGIITGARFIHRIPVSHWGKGQYLIWLSAEDVTLTQKFVKL
mgnify:FL=1